MKTKLKIKPQSLKTLIILLNLCFVLSACSSKTTVLFNGDYTENIDSRETFNKLKGEPLSDKYSNIEAVKVMYEVKTGKIFFISSSVYPYHYDFAYEILNVPYSLSVFNEESYISSATRKFILATIDYFPDANIYAVEFVGSDLSNNQDITLLFYKIRDNTFFGDDLKLLANTSQIQDLISKNTLLIPYITPDVVFSKQHFQPVNTGEAYGYLKRIYNVKNANDSINYTDIMLINQNPIDLPQCAAIITTQFQTPLSHINVLSHNRKMACMMYTEAWIDSQLKDYENQLIKLTINRDTFLIEKASIEDAEKFWKNNNAPKTKKLKSDLTIKQIVDLKDINKKAENYIGSKATNFGILNKIQDGKTFKTPEGAFAIPFYFYDEHIHQPEIYPLLLQLWNDTALQNNKTALEAHLKKLRKAIKDAPINLALVNEVEKKMKSNDYGISYRFRSSTNAEDLQGFNGAGLYDSKTGILNDDIKSVSKAIKDIWASTFTQRAYTERKIFHIVESTVCMGILVHRNFPEETSNGVAITTNLYRSDFPGFVINVQKGEISVVAPGDKIICDQFIVYNTKELGERGDHIVSEYITLSNQNDGKPILSQDQIAQLYAALSKIKAYYYTNFYSDTGYQNYDLDIEFKFDGDKGLYIKQVRPY